MSLSLVVLAAGMGSRYGGLKQIDPVGPAGETVLDYAVFDALRAGFTRVVFVIRRDFEAVFREKIGARYAGRVAVEYVFQAADVLPSGYAPFPGREKPWGTGHAVWCARDAVQDNFAVINADDFYGADSFRRLAGFLRGANMRGPRAAFAMVGFRLANTLSEHGTVSRGVCTTGADGALQAIVERTSIAPANVGPGLAYSGQEIVSMNCWGFTPALFPALEAQLSDFLAGVTARPPGAGVDPMKAEFYLPAAVSTMIGRREADVQVLPTDSSWFGVTYREDKPRVSAAIADLVKAGTYPAQLF
ncbi:sugar phosphate nucleotidyltransferase [Opitutus sp. ER46]|uniref:nucleotidyltransferase family protein n=1 Tax=Opitutus sp. ER46 TaxID=2161864 RepID=UPI000D31223A|nr:sugar phosphate nucleotidyltransferase [Opitutus sp. ER46]PTX91455.1 nucleotidyltransferase [Opitutus sp. ER46]